MATASMALSFMLSLTDKLTAPLNAATDAVKAIGESVQMSAEKMREFGNELNEAGKEFGRVGKDLSMKLTLPIVGLGTAVVKSSLDFNKGMANIATLIPGNQRRVKQLGDAILQMSKDSGTSTDDLTAGMYQVVSAFGDSAESVKQLDAANKAAKAGLATTTQAVDLLSAVTKGYGDTSAAAVTKASDLAFATLRLGQTTFPELASSMGKVIPMAKAMNTTQEELFATFATLTGVTGSASEVSSQLKGVFSSMMKPSTEMAAAIRQLGYSGADAMVSQLGLVGSMQKLVAATGGNQEKIAALFSSVEGLSAVLALTGAQAGTFKDKMAEMGRSAGATNQAFKDQTTGVGAAGFNLEKLMATMKALAIQIGSALLPFVEKLAGVFKIVADVISSLPSPVINLVLAIAGIAAAIGPVMGVVSAFKKLGVVMKMLKAHPVFLVIAAVAALASLFSRAKTTIDGVKNATDGMNDAMKNASKNDDMLRSLKAAKEGTAEYETQLQSLIAANPDLEKSNINLKSSYEDVAAAVAKLNEQQLIQAKSKALDEYKAGINTLGDLSKTLMVAERDLADKKVGEEGYIEAKIKFDEAKWKFNEMTQTLQNAGKLVEYDQSKIAKDIIGASKFEIFGKDLSGNAINSVLSGLQPKATGSDLLPQALQGILQEVLTAPPKTQELAGSIAVHMSSDGQAAVTGARFNGGAINVFMPTAAGRTRG